jgi:hypothetical protein
MDSGLLQIANSLSEPEIEFWVVEHLTGNRTVPIATIHRPLCSQGVFHA